MTDDQIKENSTIRSSQLFGGRPYTEDIHILQCSSRQRQHRYEKIMGHLEYMMNDNGERFADMCAVSAAARNATSLIPQRLSYKMLAITFCENVRALPDSHGRIDRDDNTTPAIYVMH